MKTLHVLKREPDQLTGKLIEMLSEGEEAIQFKLYEEHPDYDRLIDLAFQHDKIISWW